MKKVLCAIFVLVVLSAMFMSVSAEISPEKVPGVTIKDKDGKDVNDFIIVVVDNDLTTVIKGKNPSEGDIAHNTKTHDLKQIVVEGVIVGDINNVDFPVTITVKVEGAVKGTKVKVVIFDKDQNVVKVIDGECLEDGFITFTLEDEETALSGYYLINYLVETESPDTGVNVEMVVLLVACFAIMSVSSLSAVKLIKQK